MSDPRLRRALIAFGVAAALPLLLAIHAARRDPVRPSADGIADGLALYAGHCAACHGTSGRGDGPAAVGMRIPPADLTAPHLLMHGDAEMFAWLSDGIRTRTGRLVMPGFAASLSARQRWDLIDALRARNLGVAHAELHRWPVPVRAPSLGTECDLIPEPRDILLTDRGAILLAGGRTCLRDDPAIGIAFAAMLGARPATLPGMRFSLDAWGVIRAAPSPGRSMCRHERQAVLF